MPATSMKKKHVGAVTVIHDTAGRSVFAVVPWIEYERLKTLDQKKPASGKMVDEEAAEVAALDRARLASARRVEAARKAGPAVDAYIPFDVVSAMIDGASAVKAWREYRGLTQAALAAKIGVSRAYLTQIESGRRNGTADVLARLARALDVLADDLIDEGAPRRRQR